MSRLVPAATVRAPEGMVAAADQLAAFAGAEALSRGGTAADAAVAAAAVLAVTLPNQCGMGGDLFALVHRAGEDPVALNASGRAGAGADAERLRAEGWDRMPFRHDVRIATVPGCVDGWTALHERYGRLELAELLAPALRYARDGFPVLPGLAAAGELTDAPGLAAYRGLRAGQRLRAPGLARALEAIAARGRDGFYAGPVGCELVAVAGGELTEEDVTRAHADWAPALGLDAFGHRLWSTPPSSQGYLLLSSAWIAERVGVPADADDSAWAHVLVDAARHASWDRDAVLFDGADGAELISPDRLAARADIDPERTRNLSGAFADGDTTYLCAVDGERMAVSLIQSVGASFGCHVTLPEHGIVLQNRGTSFSLEPGHPAEYAPGRRPPHSLMPVVVTREDGSLAMVTGAMGGDGQPQIALQLLARTLLAGEDPADALAAGRWVLTSESTRGFDTWFERGDVIVRVEEHAPADWLPGLQRRGHRVAAVPAFADRFGHAQLIAVDDDGLAGASDPRSRGGTAVGL